MFQHAESHRAKKQLLTGIAVIGLALNLTGCIKARAKYQPPATPKVDQNSQWNTQPAGGAMIAAIDEAALSQWWTGFNDPLLASLEERAVKGNLSLRKADAAIRQARAQRNVAAAGGLPSVAAGASANGNRSSSQTGGNYGQSYGLNVDASWEADFFHRTRQNLQAYDADLAATQEDLRDTLVSLVAEVALNYIDIRSYQAQLATTRSNLSSQEETYRLTQARADSGLATQLDAEQARMTVESTRSEIPTLETSLQKSMNSLALLLGERPGALDKELATIQSIPQIPLEVAIGLPADLLRRRPDIRSAEQKVAAQAARVGAANLNLYPTFTLSGSFGMSALRVWNLTPSAIVSSLAGSIQQTLFSRQKIREQIKVQDAVLDQYLTTYEETVLTAVKDVEDALQSFAKEQERRNTLAQAVNAAEHAAEMSKELYSVGLKDYLNVLETQRSLLNLQNQWTQSNASIAENLVRLYKSLGGGWNQAAPTGGLTGMQTASDAVVVSPFAPAQEEDNRGKEIS